MRRLSTIVSFVAVLAVAGGCGQSGPIATVRFQETVKPATPLSEQYMQMAVMDAQMEGDTGEYDQDKWSRMTADLLEHYLQRAREEYGMPVKLVDREHLKLTMGEKDLAAAGITDTGDAMAASQVEGAKAVLISKVTVKIDKQVGKKRTIDALSLAGGGWSRGGWGAGSVGSTEVDEEARTITVQCQFQLKDSATNEIIVSHNARPMQESTKTSAGGFFGSSKTEADMTPRDQVIGGMVERQAQDFLAKFIPVEISDQVQVESSGHEMSEAGVRCLVIDDYETALMNFKQAIAEDPDDHESMFGAGVACEKLRRMDEAKKYYKQALSLDIENERYKRAVDRVSRG